MTLDVKIGEVVYRKDGVITVFDDIRLPEMFIAERNAHIEQCPNSENAICKPKFTLWTKEAYRSGSLGFWDFWLHYAPDVYEKLRRHPDSNDFDVAYIKPIIEEIMALPTPCNEADADRMKWLKYWCQKAVELYGDEAGISFS